ncbi:MAG: hypothetical protein COU08_00125 [Candidatus Harrisonbacteria bacterium CG10_big_fil_rev_8_21_14_0_10_42_17]|uniref:Response regulatory domain-containing protein n=1 Tax=Candidatus Harrisonbacteria bacterium CG10_big_fil_rev_8_21_14_0_10_42_17 TaxID=1974584 RepID=A0A2M6WJB7_9BACT|nr:MAG: hypothetical protein COU08_00125 [Candidatus Harrisonbacteria bacterium CG10_big_fil_rev_8_21_14_0_10_42_17]
MNHYQKKALIVEVVEDDKALSLSLSDNLKKEGIGVIVVGNGEEGLAIAIKEKPDLILLDILMPKMDGMTMLRKLRALNEWGKHVPVIILTNLSSNDEKRMRDVTELEPTYYLEKVDWKICDVLEKVKDRLGLLPSQQKAGVS